MKTTLSILLVLTSSTVFGLSLDTAIKTLTPENLFEKSDLVAITNIESGSYHKKSFTYSLKGRLQLIIKGKSKQKIIFSDAGLWENAAKLNGNYLVFLQQKNGHLSRVHSSQSVIELHRIEEADVSNREIFLKEMGIAMEATFAANEDLWVVSHCIKKNDDLCKEFSAAFQFAMKKL